MVVVGPNVFAKTERLLLRPLKLDDAEDVVLMRKDPEVMKHTYVIHKKCLRRFTYQSSPLLPNDDLECTKEWIRGTLRLHTVTVLGSTLLMPNRMP